MHSNIQTRTIVAIHKEDIDDYIDQYGLLGTPYKLPLFVSVMAHLAVLLLVGFAVSRIDLEQPQPNIKITLTNSITEQAPEDADTLAQFNNVGGSDDDSEELAKTFTEAQTLPDISNSNIVRRPSIAKREELHRQLPTVLGLDSQYQRAPNERADDQTSPTDQQSDSRAAFADARLSATLDDHIEKLSNGARHQYISVSTRQYDYAAYMASWVKKVESIGNQKIPESFRLQDISGDLVLDAAINTDGSVASVSIWRSSGIEAVDLLARQIVFDAAPYPPLDNQIRKKTDVLHIIRTWRFNTRSGLSDISQ